MPKGIPKNGINKGWYKTGFLSLKKGKTIRINTCKNCGKQFMRQTKGSTPGCSSYQIVSFCSAKCRSKYGIPSRRGKGITPLFICKECGKEFKGKYSQRKRIYFCSQKCRIANFRKRGIFQKGAINSLIKQGFKKQPNSIETKVYQELKLRGFLFETQKPVGNRYVVDAYIPSLNLVVECDGSYWHSLPKAIENDKRKNAYLKKRRYRLVRLTETEIKDGRFKTKLSQFIN